MSSDTVEPTVVLGLPEAPTTTAGKINRTAKSIAFWTFMGLGLLAPPILGIYGIITG